MLVLSRRKGESIIIGENAEIIITNIQGNNVQLGIIAPKSVPVHRKEVYESIQRERGLKRERYLPHSCSKRSAAAVEA